MTKDQTIMTITYSPAAPGVPDAFDYPEANAFIRTLRMAAQGKAVPQDMDRKVSDPQPTIRMRDPYFSFELI